MTVIYKFKCPDCFEVFRSPDKPDWDFCPKCKTSLKVRDDDEICMPAFIGAKTKATDKVYRDLEAGSNIRAQAASEMLGVSAADVSDLKINNLRDTKYGEVANVPVDNEVSRLMARAPDATGFQAAGVNFSTGVQTGPFANTGAKFQTEIRKAHTQAAGWGAMSDNPSLEVQQPGYRRRA